jgi:hypothetical protein
MVVLTAAEEVAVALLLLEQVEQVEKVETVLSL